MQTPLDDNFAMVRKIKEKSTHNLPSDGSLLGWCCMVAPTSETLHAKMPSNSDTTPVGIIPKLPGPGDASYEMAPSLCSIIRKVLEGRKVSHENITLYLRQIRKQNTYEKAFRTFWAFCQQQGINLPSAPLEEIAIQLQKCRYSVTP